MLKEYFALQATFNDQMNELANQNRFDYIFSKAYLYLKMGPEIYRRKDAFQMPNIEWDKEYYPELQYGCEQLLIAKGLLKDNPIENIDTLSFKYLFSMFHYDCINIKSHVLEVDNKVSFIDEVLFQHYIDESLITYFQWVKYY
jgi:hypothetical protein